MELEEANKDLRAMRLLYRLLEDNSIGLQNNNSEDLVERARVLLENMIDIAAERVVETHLKIIATQASVCSTPCTSQPANSVNSQHSRPVKHQPCKDDKPQRLPMSGISGNKGTNRNKLSSFGEESSMMWQNLVKATKSSKKKTIPLDKDISHCKQHNENLNTSHGGDWCANEPPEISEDKVSVSSVANEVPLFNKIDETQCNPRAAVGAVDNEIDLSNDVVNAVKRIESRILALQHCSNLVPSSKESAGRHSMYNLANTDSPVMQRKDGISSGQLSSGRSPLDVNELRNTKASLIAQKNGNLTSRNEFEEIPVSTEAKSPSQAASQNVRLQSIGTSRHICCQKVGGVSSVPQLLSGHEELPSENRVKRSAQDMTWVDKVQSWKQSARGNDHLVSKASRCIQGFRVPLCQDNLVKSPSILRGHQTNKGYPIRNPNSQVETDRKAMRPELSKAPKLMGNLNSTISRRDKKPSHQMIIGPTLLDQNSSEIKVSPGFHRDETVLERKGTHEARHVNTQKKRGIQRCSEKEESSSGSHSYSSWMNQQESATSTSDSEDYSLPGSTPAHEYMAPPSRWFADKEYDGCSEESSVSCEEFGSSYRMGNLRSYRSRHKRNPQKSVGRLQWIKNKLGLIFHHHHHHHHYHHDGGDSKTGPHHSMWNNLQRIFPHKTKHEQLNKQKIEKPIRKTVARVTHRNQTGQFHGIVEGVLRHLRHSKKPKTSKILRNAPPGHGKKLHRWQMIQKRCQGVKLKSGNRLKIGLKSQKSLKN